MGYKIMGLLSDATNFIKKIFSLLCNECYGPRRGAAFLLNYFGEVRVAQMGVSIKFKFINIY
jgi:hypothetical protein